MACAPRPKALNGAGMPERGRTHRKDGLDRAALDIIDAAIALHGPTEPQKVMSDTILAECDRRGIDPPSNGTIWNAVRLARRNTGPVVGADAEVIIGRVWADLPVRMADDPSHLVRPEMLVALKLPERLIIDWACDLTTGGPPSMKDLANLSAADRPVRITDTDAGTTAKTACLDRSCPPMTPMRSSRG